MTTAAAETAAPPPAPSTSTEPPLSGQQEALPPPQAPPQAQPVMQEQLQEQLQQQQQHSATEENLRENLTADTFTTHDVVLGKGNGINSLPGNLQFRKIIVKYKPLYASTPRSLKGSVAEIVINEIACLGGKFLEPQADQRFREVSRKRALEKTCQALREKKNNVGPQAAGVVAYQQRAQQVSPDQQQQQQQQEQEQAAPPAAVAATAATAVPPNGESSSVKQEEKPELMDVDKEKLDEEDAKDDSKETTGPVTIMENDVLYGGRGRRHFHRVANQRFLELVKMSRKEYHDSRCKKLVAKRIVKEWQSQHPPGRFLQQDSKTEKWYEINESKIMEKTCQALRDLKRERGPAGVKQGISDRMVDPWEKMPYPPPMRPGMNGGQPMLTQGPHPYHHPGPWMGPQPMYNPQNMMQGGGMMQPQLPPQYMQQPPPPPPPLQANAALPAGAPNGMVEGKGSMQSTLSTTPATNGAPPPPPPVVNGTTQVTPPTTNNGAALASPATDESAPPMANGTTPTQAPITEGATPTVFPTIGTEKELAAPIKRQESIQPVNEGTSHESVPTAVKEETPKAVKEEEIKQDVPEIGTQAALSVKTDPMDTEPAGVVPLILPPVESEVAVPAPPTAVVPTPTPADTADEPAEESGDRPNPTETAAKKGETLTDDRAPIEEKKLEEKVDETAQAPGTSPAPEPVAPQQVSTDSLPTVDKDEKPGEKKTETKPSKDGDNKEGEKQASKDKGEGNRKNGELEAAALLANMFR